MKYILKTERLILREFELTDAKCMFELNADPEVIQYTGDPSFKSVDEAKAFLENYSDYKRNSYGRWAVILKETNEFIGWCGLKYQDEGFVDLGFRFFKNQWRKGYASEAAKAVLRYGFETLKLDEIIGRVVSGNISSVRVLEKLNMQFQRYDTCHGFENTRYYRISKEEYYGKCS